MRVRLAVSLPVFAAFLCAAAAAVAQSVAPSPSPDALTPAAPRAGEGTGLISHDPVGRVFAEIETSRGTVEAELDFRRAPLTVMNFIGLAEGALAREGRPFFDGLTFHRVVPDFVAQGGDPGSADPATTTEKLGEGGPGYAFPDEFHPGLRHDGAGALSMANDGPDTNGSQFFITLRETNRLNYLHSVFGQVTRGMETVRELQPGDRIARVTIRRAGPAAERFRAEPGAFEELKRTTVEKRRAPAPAGFVYFEDGTGALPEFRVRNFNFKLANYERATGHRLVVRVLPGEATESQARRRTKTLAEELGLPDEGDNALACLFAGSGAWKLRLGEATFPALLGRGGPAAELMRGKFLHERKGALLAPAQALLDAGKVKESCDAVIDGLILGLDDFALSKDQDAAKAEQP